VENPTGRYSLKLEGSIQGLSAVPNFVNAGIVSPRVPLPINFPGAHKAVNKATHLCWAYPLLGVCPDTLGEVGGRMFLSISTSAELRFVAYGGFLLLDAAGNVVKALAVGDDSDTALKFEEATPWKHPEALQVACTVS
jgi:hypothetical protein